MASIIATRFLRRQPSLATNNLRRRRSDDPLSNRIRRHASVDAAAPANATPPSGGGGAGGATGKLFFSSLCLGTFGLGTWQTKRYFEKVEMVKKREDDLNLDPLDSFDEWRSLTDDATTNDRSKEQSKKNVKSYRRVHLEGTFRHDEQILIGPRGPPPGALAESGPNSGRGGGGGMSSGAQGYWVVTPLVVSDGASTAGASVESIASDDAKIITEGATPRRGWFGRIRGGAKRGPPSTAPEERTSEERPPDAMNEEQTIVWVNRGWIPRTYINKQNEINEAWEQPNGVVRLMAMESKTETPGTYSPPSRLDSKNKNASDEQTVEKLLWMDRQAMEEVISCPSDCHPPLFVEINQNEDKSIAQSFPVKPSREFVGEFKVTPEIHAGYAFTWFGLSGAGMVMTRKILTKGRY